MFEKRKLVATKDGLRVHIPYGNASRANQYAWQRMGNDQKRKLLKTLKDSDKDSRPNGFDCHVRDKRRQDDFTQEEKEWLSRNKLEPSEDDYIDCGFFGDVYSLKGNDDYVIKIPRRKVDTCTKSAIEGESKIHKKLKMDKMSMMSPSKTIKLSSMSKLSIPTPKYCDRCKECVGIVRPKVTPASKDKDAWTDDKIYELKEIVRGLSKQGIILGDGLQVGLDKKGKIVQFDTNRISKTKNIRKSMDSNAVAFIAFLMEDLGFSKAEAAKYLKD